MRKQSQDPQISLYDMLSPSDQQFGPDCYTNRQTDRQREGLLNS